MAQVFKPSMRGRGGHARGEYDDPDLVPMMNIMLLLLPVILQFIQVIKYTEISYNPSPKIIMPGDPNDISRGGGGEGVEVTNKPFLSLLLNVTTDAFQVSIKNGVKGDVDKYWEFPKVPKKGGFDYDYDGLSMRLNMIRRDVIGKYDNIKETTDPLTGAKKYTLSLKYGDGHQIHIAAMSTVPWKVVTHVLDICRVYKSENFPDGSTMPLFPEPIFGQL